MTIKQRISLLAAGVLWAIIASAQQPPQQQQVQQRWPAQQSPAQEPSTQLPPTQQSPAQQPSAQHPSAQQLPPQQPSAQQPPSSEESPPYQGPPPYESSPPAREPSLNVSPYRHGNIARAQQYSRAAFDAISQAQQSNEFDLGGHAERAKQLLAQANDEMKLAAQWANHRR